MENSRFSSKMSGSKKGSSIKYKKQKGEDMSYLLGLLEIEQEYETFEKKKFPHFSSIDPQKYINANCRFVISSSADTTKYMNSPDFLIKWDLILKIITQVPPRFYCPICLEETLITPRITECGHIYCWPCILKHITYSYNSKFPYCPLCYKLLEAEKLKICQIIYTNEINEGDEIEFILMKKYQDSIIVGGIESNILNFPYIRDPYSKFNKINFCNSKNELIFQDYEHLMMVDNDILKYTEEERMFFASCLQEVEVTQKIHSEEVPNFHIQNKDKSEKIKINESNYDKMENNSFSNTNFNSNFNEKEFYFYQKSNGELMFLHPLNFKCLYEEYGIKSLPRRIKGKVLQKDLLHLSSASLRKKYKLLSHIPLSTFVSILEINIDNYISEETYELFQKEIEERYHLREINQETSTAILTKKKTKKISQSL